MTIDPSSHAARHAILNRIGPHSRTGLCRAAKCVVLVGALLTLSTDSSAQVTQAQLQTLASRLAGERGNMRVQLYVDGARAQGRAYVYGSSTQAYIWTDPAAMRRYNLNTWAFFLGHELGHPSLGLGGGPQAERRCDEFGAQLAIKLGYDIDEHVTAMLNSPESRVCSPSHGCEIERIRNLATRFGSVSTNKWGDQHVKHPSAIGFPIHESGRGPAPGQSCWAGRGGRCRHEACSIPQVKVPCDHLKECQHLVECAAFGCTPVPCKHLVECTHPTGCVHVVGCRHRTACTHWGRPHLYDIAHPLGDLVHPQGDAMHPRGDWVHPQGDNPHQGGHPQHPGGHPSHGEHKLHSPFCLRELR